ncbi:NUDIX hydrolase [Bacillus sp. DTU_2020_1000418_1_SI_GHA_SEK_038]|uniref:NUDIX hydrolase n=1 Tax=Bacillus sp. DTU_2020_1000418_1_SI_GHA_SEK_038 TaxID=3077585 RepID=UPI0028E7EBF0|nr:NUDIX hydrolase [Bacillus sp. DTU_2020_1000418_1_SI_GHA_SEK_038]WNS74800.1 NUDIX hydrolase [Bacillus sp. DTU_2020_1000418_1_SI_GHA_SEK_038]
MSQKRGKVWLAVSGLVISPDSKWLVVKKKYGGLKGSWSLPAGFVDPGETADEAVIREVEEETGIKCTVKGMIGLRTGVIKDEISDNMIIFVLEALPEQTIQVQDGELYDVQFIDPLELAEDENASILLKYLANRSDSSAKPLMDGMNPGDQFGYTAYRLFL